MGVEGVFLVFNFTCKEDLRLIVFNMDLAFG